MLHLLQSRPMQNFAYDHVNRKCYKPHKYGKARVSHEIIDVFAMDTEENGSLVLLFSEAA